MYELKYTILNINPELYCKKNNYAIIVIFAVICLIFNYLHLPAQSENGGIGTLTPDNSAALELSTSLMSVPRGFLMTRMSTATRNSITSPATSLIIFNTDNNRFEYNSGTPGSPNWVGIISTGGILPIANGGTNTNASPTAGGIAYGTGTAYAFTAAGTSGFILTSAGAGTPTWTNPSSLSGGWSLTGNSGIDPNNNFVGTTDGQDLIFKTGGSGAGNERMRILSTGNIGIGINNPSTNIQLFLNNNSTTPGLLIQQNSTGDAGQRFNLTNSNNISMGIDQADNNNFKITKKNVLTGTDSTMIRMHTEVNKEGIIDFNHQSRARVYLSANQTINNNSWTKIQFDTKNFDEKTEYDNLTNFRFTAKVDGYYQVNSRTEFDFTSLGGGTTNSYISIAIYKTGSVNSYGNDLGIIANTSDKRIPSNNAPVVNDIIYLQANDYIEIWIFQNTGSNYQIVGGRLELTFQFIK